VCLESQPNNSKCLESVVWVYCSIYQPAQVTSKITFHFCDSLEMLNSASILSFQIASCSADCRGGLSEQMLPEAKRTQLTFPKYKELK